MSEALDDRPPPHPWKKIAIWGAIGVTALGFFVFFSGNIPVPWHRHHDEPPAYHVAMNSNIGALERPAPLPLAAQDTPKPRPAADILRQQATTPADDTRKKALESGLDGYVIKTTATTTPTAHTPSTASPDGLPAANQPDALEAALTPTRLEGTRVSELPDPRWLIEQGRDLPCLQMTRINTSLPGMVTAQIPPGIRGETGDVVLLPQGAKVVGTIQHALINGLDRIAVLWQQITTPVMYGSDGMPHQYRIAVDSPAASELGETGLEGDVNRHLGKKIGGIIGYTILTGAVQAGVGLAQNHGGNGNTTLNLNSFQQGGNNAADELLRQWVNIPDIATRDQGLACSIHLARDLDFRGAYRLVQR